MEQFIFMVTDCGSSNFQLFIFQLMTIFVIGCPMGRFPAKHVASFVLPLCGRVLSCHSHVLEDIRRSETNVCRNQPLVPLVSSVVCRMQKVTGYQCVQARGQ